jgi:hypothetical protein
MSGLGQRLALPSLGGRRPPRRVGDRLSALSPLQRDLLLVCAALPVIALGGALIASLSSEFGAAKVIWVLLAAGGAVLSLADFRVAIAVLLLALAFSFRTKLVFGVEVHTSHLILLLVAAQGLAALYFRRNAVPPGFVVPMLLMIIGGVVAAVAGPETGEALFRLVAGLLPGLLAALAIACLFRPERDLRALVLVVAASLVGTALAALYQAAGGTLPGGVGSFEEDRVNGYFGHPNILGGYLTANILLLLGVAAYAWRPSSRPCSWSRSSSSSRCPAFPSRSERTSRRGCRSWSGRPPRRDAR